MPTGTTLITTDSIVQQLGTVALGSGCGVLGRGVMVTSIGFVDTGNSKDDNILLNPQKYSL